MAAVTRPVTATLGLPLSLKGHVALAKGVARAFNLIDAAILALQGGVAALDATQIAYDGDESNSGSVTVGAALDDIFTRLAVVEARTDSNSQG